MFPTEKNINNIQNLIDNGYISIRKCPKNNYWIYKYTNKTQFERNWTEETLNCRG